MIVYSFTIRWYEFNGTMTAIRAESTLSMGDAISKSFADAKECGWTPPRWWQWWRWKEHVRREILPTVAGS
jgi:hypothetical protein